MTHQDPAGPPVMPPPPPSAPAPDSNRNVMIVLAYLWLLALVPLLAEKNDREVQWHAKHGLVLLVAEVVVWVVYGVLGMIPGVGCALAIAMPLIWLAFVAVRVVCIVKGVNGQRCLIPGLSDFADKL